ncbi:hypothetical protein NX907_28560, partial [Burkholderia thailandensis]|nr:hypothetical protein [Burkholderia thailandensis]
MQALVVDGATPRIRNNVVNRSGDNHAPCLQTGLTEAAVAAQHALPDLVPRVSVSSPMTIAAHRVGLPFDGLVRMLIAVRLTIRDERTAPPVLARLHRASCHLYKSANFVCIFVSNVLTCAHALNRIHQTSRPSPQGNAAQHFGDDSGKD